MQIIQKSKKNANLRSKVDDEKRDVPNVRRLDI